MASYERLSAVDAQFLYWDSIETPMNMGNVCVFEGAPFFDGKGVFKLDEVRQAIASRLHLVPRYRKKLMLMPGGVGHPVLVDDPDFDIAKHVRVMKAPAPGGEEELKQMFGRVHEGMLDRSRPLWEICFVEGLQGGRVGMIQKIHHAPYDGQSTVDVLERLMDKSPHHVPAATPPYKPIPAPNHLEVLANNVMHQANLAWSAMFSGPEAPVFHPSRWGKLAKAASSLKDLPKPPPSSLNQPLGPRRRFDWVATTLEDAKRIRGLVPGATLNDAMLACIAGGIRALMASRGEPVDTADVRVFIPVSLRAEDERDAEGGNRISGFVAPLPVAETDPVVRLRTIQETTARFKKGVQPLGIHLVSQWVEFLPAPLLKAGAPFVARNPLWQNLTVTNVQGPRQTLYLLGAKMLELNPMVPIGCQLSLNFAVESYVGDLKIGLSSDGDLLPDLKEAKRGIEASLRELLQRAGKPAAPAVVAKKEAVAEKAVGKKAAAEKAVAKKAAVKRTATKTAPPKVAAAKRSAKSAAAKSAPRRAA